MAIPSSYTELSLADFMRRITGNVAAALGWTADDFDEAVNETLLAYGVDELSSVTDVAKLRALARVAAWRALVDATAAEYNFSADGGTFSRQQIQDGCKAGLARALETAAPWLPEVEQDELEIKLGSMGHTDEYSDYATLFGW